MNRDASMKRDMLSKDGSGAVSPVGVAPFQAEVPSLPAKRVRYANWDLLRTLAMVAVIVVHTGGYLATIHGVNVGTIASKAALLCDPVFFTLSGFFAIRPLKTSYGKYLIHKASTIIVPLLVYSVVLYLYTAFAGGDALSGT